METPSIVVEPPREEVDLIDGGHNASLNSALQVYYNGTYSCTTSSARNASAEQGLFSTPLEHSSHSSGQISPLITTGLRDGTVQHAPNYPYREFEGIITVTSGNMFLSASGQNSPIEALSPASTSSGDLFPETWSDTSSTWSPSVESSSPSSPSLSPINTSMLNFTFNDAPYLEESFSSQQNPGTSRMRSNSYSGGSDSPPGVNNGGRPRSASFTNVNVSTFLPPDSQPQWVPSYHQNEIPLTNPMPNDFSMMDTSLFSAGASTSFGSPTSPSYSPTNDAWSVTEVPPGAMPGVTFNYPPPEGPPPSTNQVFAHSRSHSTHLTVPLAPSLQRRGAHRRSHSHTGVHDHASSPTSPASPDSMRGSFPSTRGRQPTPGFAANRSRPSSAASLTREPSYSQIDQSAAFLSVNPATQYPSHMSDSSSYLSPSPAPSSASPSPVQSPLIGSPVELAVPDFTGMEAMPSISVDDSLVRRHSFAGGSSQSHDARQPQTLHRAASDPVGRGRRARPRPRFPGLLRPQNEVDEVPPPQELSIMINVPVEGIASTSTATTPLSSDSEHKEMVASNKIVDASTKRRKKPGERGRFICPICNHNFTAKHNLNNHMNSHSGVKPFKCEVCKQTFTTSGTAKRHQNNCTGKMPRKRS
ncbi:hypothetical protein V5O48_006482 [Marasmius crinis-equi]|uniref:C2H2-type domain-containing protein n=1 Tax=Marasmius crinis-equi TaxID=585013 RepID=A0ABR3FJE7_9AGAR